MHGLTTEQQHQLLSLLAQLRPASSFHLLQALAAREVEGITGTLVIKIPRKTSDPVDIAFVGGDATLKLEM